MINRRNNPQGIAERIQEIQYAPIRARAAQEHKARQEEVFAMRRKAATSGMSGSQLCKDQGMSSGGLSKNRDIHRTSNGLWLYM